MKRVIKLFAAVMALLICAHAAHAQAVNTVNRFTVQQAVEYAKKNSVQVKNALLDYKIQQQTNREITSAAYPQLNGSGTFQDFLNIPTSLIPAEFSPGEDLPAHSFR